MMYTCDHALHTHKHRTLKRTLLLLCATTATIVLPALYYYYYRYYYYYYRCCRFSTSAAASSHIFHRGAVQKRSRLTQLYPLLGLSLFFCLFLFCWYLFYPPFFLFFSSPLTTVSSILLG